MLSTQTVSASSVNSQELTLLAKKASDLLLSVNLGEVRILPSSGNSAHFENLTTAQQDSVLFSLNQFYKSLQAATLIEPEPSGRTPFGKDFEIAIAKNFLASLGLHVSDEIWSTIEDGDVIEIYNLEGIQLFRSLSFFKYCSYTLSDILSLEWFHLWHRPKSILESMHDNIGRALSSESPIFKTDVPTHVLRETDMAQELYGVKPKACLVNFKYIAVTTSHPLSRAPKGFISTASGELIAEGDEAKKIHFV